jgi:hypothetical protein
LQQVRAGPARQNVVAITGPKRIAPPAAGQHVVPTIADKRIGKGGAAQVLDAHQHIARRFAGEALPRPQAHENAARGLGVTGGVGPVLPLEQICTRAARQHIVAIPGPERIHPTAAGQNIVSVIADKRVREARAAQVLDPHQHIARRFAGEALPRPEAHENAAGASA